MNNTPLTIPCILAHHIDDQLQIAKTCYERSVAATREQNANVSEFSNSEHPRPLMARSCAHALRALQLFYKLRENSSADFTGIPLAEIKAAIDIGEALNRSKCSTNSPYTEFFHGVSPDRLKEISLSLQKMVEKSIAAINAAYPGWNVGS